MRVFLVKNRITRSVYIIRETETNYSSYCYYIGYGVFYCKKRITNSLLGYLLDSIHFFSYYSSITSQNQLPKDKIGEAFGFPNNDVYYVIEYDYNVKS